MTSTHRFVADHPTPADWLSGVLPHPEALWFARAPRRPRPPSVRLREMKASYRIEENECG
jgi:hypothetical protein